MPVLQISRQPDALAWFGSTRGQPLLAAEQEVVRAALASRPGSQPWLWLGPVRIVPGSPGSVELPPRGLWLHPCGTRYSGSLQCSLPLPLPDESIGNLIVQHVLDDDRPGLLEECTRVLEPGGRLWLFVLNPWSPYRARWRRSGLVARDRPYWRYRLRQLGLQPVGHEDRGLGPVWRVAAAGQTAGPGHWRAAHLLEVEKRAIALVPPAPVKRQWQADAAPA